MSTGSENEPRNPALAVDAIVRLDEGIVLIKRENPPEGWALPGGFVEYGETVESAVRRELREETGLRLNDLRQWRVFSDPDRDPRQHVVSTVFLARGEGNLKADSDAAAAELFDPIPPWPDLAFDHEFILEQFRLFRAGKEGAALP
jgi:ADP-ribose pyrophosphatase YjhB (NUDIX family)